MKVEASVYDRMCWPEEYLEAALATGRHRRELLAFFGERDYRELALLAGKAAQRGARARHPRSRRRHSYKKIYLLPGMLGTQLGWARSAAEPPDLLWLDPADVTAGRLSALRWSARRRGQPLTTLGAIPHTYLALKLRLAAAGFEVIVHQYDWRADLTTLAQALAQRLDADAADELLLVGHSMGGLLARAALSHPGGFQRRVRAIIGLGAPQGGSIGAVQALRASYPVILRLAALDRLHDPRGLSADVFGTFASLYQMLPAPTDLLDLFDPHAWPASRATSTAPAPRAALLRRARRFRAGLVEADERFVSIIGTGQRTVTGLARVAGQFRYEVSDGGDGTVAASHATLPGARNYSLHCEHSELPRSARVAAAVIELCQSGQTQQLRAGVRVRKGDCVFVTDAMLWQAFEQKLDWPRLSATARRRYLNALNAPPSLYRAPR